MKLYEVYNKLVLRFPENSADLINDHANAWFKLGDNWTAFPNLEYDYSIYDTLLKMKLIKRKVDKHIINGQFHGKEIFFKKVQNERS